MYSNYEEKVLYEDENFIVFDCISANYMRNITINLGYECSYSDDLNDYRDNYIDNEDFPGIFIGKKMNDCKHIHFSSAKYALINIEKQLTSFETLKKEEIILKRYVK